MPVHNIDIANILNRVADVLEIKGENSFRVRAYRSAARTIADTSQNITELIAEGKNLAELPGIGESLALKITEIARTGMLRQLKELEAGIPPGLSELMKIAQLGPRRIKTLYRALDIKNREELAQAARAGKIRTIKGFGPKIEQKVLDELNRLQQNPGPQRFKLNIVEEIVQPLVTYLREYKQARQVIVAGSYRRQTETVGDIDILATVVREVTTVEATAVAADFVNETNSRGLMEYFVSYPDTERIISRGDTRSTIILRTGLQVDLRVVNEESYGAALYYFTGSKAHNVAVRKLALKKNLKINEYGIFQDEKKVAGLTEEEVFSRVDLPYIEPELRENRGEIEAALRGELPRLITLKDIRGDLQSHTNATDGHNSLEEMAAAAQARGYEYLAITDHSQRVSIANGMDEKRLSAQLAQIDKLNAKLKNFLILKSCEVDILQDGRLDFSNDILRELDFVICSVHYNRNLSLEKQTARVLKAMDNPYFNIMAHPTGRLVGERPPYQIDLERIMKEAKIRGIFMEINAHPDRLDLNDIHIKRARELGVRLVISTDAHTINNLDFMRWGVGQARRGWLQAEDVLNTRSWPEMKKLFHQR